MVRTWAPQIHNHKPRLRFPRLCLPQSRQSLCHVYLTLICLLVRLFYREMPIFILNSVNVSFFKKQIPSFTVHSNLSSKIPYFHPPITCRHWSCEHHTHVSRSNPKSFFFFWVKLQIFFYYGY